jgi:TRAP transporter TAXI family solute receptor
MKRYFLFFICISLLISCRKKEHFYLSTGSTHSKHYQIGQNMAKLIEEQTDFSFELLTEGEGSVNNCEQIILGKADFALSQNDVILSSGHELLRTVMPLYPQTFFIIYDGSLKANTLKELVTGKKIAIGSEKGGTVTFTKRLFHDFGINEEDYQFVFSSYEENTISDSVPISVSVTGFDNPRIINMILKKGGKIWSLGDFQLVNRGSTVDGFCLNYPLAQPFIIPQNTYQNYPDKPILTINIDNVLLTHKNTSEDAVYETVKNISENKEKLAYEEPLFRFLTNNFRNNQFHFPLHRGAINYLERNKPSFFERYAEMFGVIITSLTIFYGLIIGMLRWNRRRRKNRIDRYYGQLLELENRAEKMEDIEELEALLKEVKEIRNVGYERLIKEQLEADESFRIFINLLNDVSEIISRKIRDNSPRQFHNVTS